MTQQVSRRRCRGVAEMIDGYRVLNRNNPNRQLVTPVRDLDHCGYESDIHGGFFAFVLICAYTLHEHSPTWLERIIGGLPLMGTSRDLDLAAAAFWHESLTQGVHAHMHLQVNLGDNLGDVADNFQVNVIRSEFAVYKAGLDSTYEKKLRDCKF